MKNKIFIYKIADVCVIFIYNFLALKSMNNYFHYHILSALEVLKSKNNIKNVKKSIILNYILLLIYKPFYRLSYYDILLGVCTFLGNNT